MPRKYKRRDQAIFQAPPAGARMLGYIRFSGEDQDAISQEAAVRRWGTQEKGWRIYPGEWFKDEAKSGTSMEGRGDFLRMIALAESLANAPDRPAGVFYWKRDRFGRDQLDNQYFTSLLRRMGYAVIGMEDGIPPNAGELTVLLETVKDIKAEWDSADISANVKRAKADLRAQGYQAGGHPPRGLREERTVIGRRKNGNPRHGIRWIPDPALAPRILQAFEMRAANREYAEIMRGPLRGVYKSMSCLPTCFANHNYVEAGVISEDLYQRVRVVSLCHARQEGQAHPRRVNSPFLLSGLLVCRCGSAMVGDLQRGRYRLYRCGARMRNRDHACTQPKVPADRLEQTILDGILACALAPEQIDVLTQAVNAELSADDGLQAEAENVRRQITETESAISKLVTGITKAGPLESLLDSLKAKETERRKLREDVLLIEAKIKSRSPTVLTRQEVADLIEAIRQHREQEDTVELRSILNLVMDRITVDGRSIHVTYKPEAKPWFAS